MLYNLIKYSPIYNNITPTNLERISCLLYADFYFIDINNIEYFIAGISDDGISSLTIEISNMLPD